MFCHFEILPNEYRLKKTNQYDDNIFAIEPLLSSCGDFVRKEFFPKLLQYLNKKVYIMIYCDNHHWTLVLLFKVTDTSSNTVSDTIESLEGKKYTCIVCDSDINKDKHPCFLQHDTNQEDHDTNEEVRYNSKKLEGAHSSFKQSIMVWLNSYGAELESFHVLDGTSNHSSLFFQGVLIRLHTFFSYRLYTLVTQQGSIDRCNCGLFVIQNLSNFIAKFPHDREVSKSMIEEEIIPSLVCNNYNDQTRNKEGVVRLRKWLHQFFTCALDKANIVTIPKEKNDKGKFMCTLKGYVGFKYRDHIDTQEEVSLGKSIAITEENINLPEEGENKNTDTDRINHQHHQNQPVHEKFIRTIEGTDGNTTKYIEIPTHSSLFYFFHEKQKNTNTIIQPRVNHHFINYQSNVFRSIKKSFDENNFDDESPFHFLMYKLEHYKKDEKDCHISETSLMKRALTTFDYCATDKSIQKVSNDPQYVSVVDCFDNLLVVRKMIIFMRTVGDLNLFCISNMHRLDKVIHELYENMVEGGTNRGDEQSFFDETSIFLKEYTRFFPVMDNEVQETSPIDSGLEKFHSFQQHVLNSINFRLATIEGIHRHHTMFECFFKEDFASFRRMLANYYTNKKLHKCRYSWFEATPQSSTTAIEEELDKLRCMSSSYIKKKDDILRVSSIDVLQTLIAEDYCSNKDIIHLDEKMRMHLLEIKTKRSVVQNENKRTKTHQLYVEEFVYPMIRKFLQYLLRECRKDDLKGLIVNDVVVVAPETNNAILKRTIEGFTKFPGNLWKSLNLLLRPLLPDLCYDDTKGKRDITGNKKDKDKVAKNESTVKLNSFFINRMRFDTYLKINPEIKLLFNIESKKRPRKTMYAHPILYGLQSIIVAMNIDNRFYKELQNVLTKASEIEKKEFYDNQSTRRIFDYKFLSEYNFFHDMKISDIHRGSSSYQTELVFTYYF